VWFEAKLRPGSIEPLQIQDRAEDSWIARFTVPWRFWARWAWRAVDGDFCLSARAGSDRTPRAVRGRCEWPLRLL